MTIRKQQEDVGTVSDIAVGRPAVVVEQFLAFGRCEVDPVHPYARSSFGDTDYGNLIIPYWGQSLPLRGCANG